MATVTTEYGWLHDAADLEDYITVNVRGQALRPQARVRRQQYAGGRSRSVTRVGSTADTQLDIVHLNRAGFEWLWEKVGRRVMYRSPFGLLVWGFYDAADMPEVGHGRDLVDVRLTIVGLTGTAEVP